MNREFVLGTIATLMQWDDEKARTEFSWLRLMSRMKYDDYQEFLAGMRFIESLADWLQQFAQRDRQVAYDFVRKRLVFLSEPEMRHLAALLYPETIEPIILDRTAILASVKPYLVWSNKKASELFLALLRRTVFIELSDGARIDVFRRANEGRISNEQVVTAPRIIKAKWNEMLKDMRKQLNDQDAKFASVVLVDDFSGSGKSLLRFEENEWKGKLQKFWKDLNDSAVLQSHLDSDWQLIVHHYVATSQAVEAATTNNTARSKDTAAGAWFERVKFTWGHVLPENFKVTGESETHFSKLVETQYDKSIETIHTQIGGDSIRWGFDACALPLVLEHNTPNNSIALLWAESPTDDQEVSMRPLFRRRQRHV